MHATFFQLLPTDAMRSFTRVWALTGCCIWCTALLAAPESLCVTARDATASTVEWTERLTNAVTGEVTPSNHSYVTVGTGLNYPTNPTSDLEFQPECRWTIPKASLL